ncbi:hypothetical protein EV702DRAFT_103564 [Suillus placidus]|uniref:Arrestin-like N-terminal domain-containing protein n=1 Tax=Suillus placidus TaxID=48579 RepID=A0A9P6ZZ62_9AGAM|nr:hypothetical protein EV702DRAFT_103564 [Suillus placidus]
MTMLRWQSLALQVIWAASILAFTDTSTESKEPSIAPYQCWASAWVRAPDMVPGDIIAGDIRIKLSGPCTDAESYVLGLRYKEKIFWKLRRQDAPIPKRPEIKYNSTDSNHDLFQVRIPVQTPYYNETEWITYQNSVQSKDLWSVHEEERIAFEIKTPLVGVEGAERLKTSFTTRFGILVPNTNYPPGLDYRRGIRRLHSQGDTDVIHSESIYEYFVEIRFGNGTISEIPAGITAFTPLYLSTQSDMPSGNVSLVPTDFSRNSKPVVDVLRSNYTVELSFPNRVYQNSSVNITATVHRMGYTNRTDTPMQLCAFLNGRNINQWQPQEFKNRSHIFTQVIRALVPSVQYSSTMSFPFNLHPCGEISFAAAPADLTREGHISSSSSEPLSLSVHVSHDAVPDFSAYYQKLGHGLDLTLHVKPDLSEPWERDFEKTQWEKQTAEMDETDFDWVPWLPLIQTRRQYLAGNVGLSFISMQNQRHVQTTPVHYLSNEARQPAFVDVSDIADLRSMTTEERDLLAPIAQPSIKVFEGGRGLPNFYFGRMEQPIYVGDTWLNKVLSATSRGQRERDALNHLLLVQ